jgi:hypothetical protein
MIETNWNSALGFNVSDSTVYVNAGTARIGNTIMSYGGGSKTFREITSFTSDDTGYQYSALALYDYLSFPDMTHAVSPIAAMNDLEFPVLIDDSTNIYAAVHPIGLFMFHSADGTQIDLINSAKII